MFQISAKNENLIFLEEIKNKVNKKINQQKQPIQLELIKDNTTFNIQEKTNDFDEKIIQVDGNIPVDLEIKQGDRFLFISYDQSSLTHGLHKYPAKFFPELPRWLIQRYSQPNNIILDPFSGSGTTNVEALLNQRHSVGIDIDPFSRFIAKVKTTPLNITEINQAKKLLLQAIAEYNSSTIIDSDIPCFPYQDAWFNREIILELAYLKKAINNLDFEQKIKDFFLVCFSSILRKVSNADDNCTRTVIRKKLNKQVLPNDSLKYFAEVILINTYKMSEFSQDYPENINTIFPENMDARTIKYKDNYFDCAITSPPYVNAVDYPRTHQLEIYWLGFYEDSLIPLKKQQVGTETVAVKDYQILHKIDIDDADEVIEKIFYQDKRRAFIAYKYLDDMKQNLLETYRVLKPGGRYIIVVGNNRIRNNLFENWKYLMEIAENIGFKIETYFGSEIIKHYIKVPREERINTDWIVILKK